VRLAGGKIPKKKLEDIASAIEIYTTKIHDNNMDYYISSMDKKKRIMVTQMYTHVFKSWVLAIRALNIDQARIVNDRSKWQDVELKAEKLRKIAKHR
jgi:hypothetical protein